MKRTNGEVVGRQVLTVDIMPNNQTRLTQSFTGQTTDESQVMVESQTLKPQSGFRHISATDEDVELETTYIEGNVAIRQGDRQSGLSVPDHSYDNDTSLFLWRTLPFEIGWEGSYNTIITNRRSRQKVNLAVVRKETVTLPSGEFEAWRLQITTSSATQTAWYADTPGRELLAYNNGAGLVFELDTAPETASR